MHDTGGDMLAFSIWEAIWLIFVTFVFITVLMILFRVIVDLFRDDSLSGWGKEEFSQLKAKILA